MQGVVVVMVVVFLLFNFYIYIKVVDEKIFGPT